MLRVLFGDAMSHALERRGSRRLLVGDCFTYVTIFGEGVEMLERGDVEEMSIDIG